MDYEFYFLCVKGNHGGPEAIHQIVDKINSATPFQAHIAYFEKDFVPAEKFKCFNVDYIPLKEVPDSSETVLCISETHTFYFRRFKKAKKIMVWLSLNYYLKNIEEEGYSFSERCKKIYHRSRLPKPFYPLLFIRDKLLRQKKHFIFDMDDVRHTYNCKYVSDYLYKNGVKESDTVFLDGPVRQEYFESEKVAKTDTVAYNPGKGAEQYADSVLKILTKDYPEFKIIPIKNMTVPQVKDTLLHAKVYFDFGFFPGPEKLVKEAALCGCNIITGLKGAAANDRDICIPNECKFDMDNCDPSAVAKAIAERAKNHEKYYNDYEPYRKFIRSLNDNFEKTVCDFANFAVK